MNSGGIIIRLIDVAMIILFGFIAISDIKVRAQIKLPTDQQEERQQTEEKEPVVLFVKIELDQGYILEENEVVIAEINEAKELEEFLLQRYEQAKASGLDMVLLVEPDENSIIQKTVDVLDICERYKIPKNINYESMQF